jgi:hypothetical protein
VTVIIIAQIGIGGIRLVSPPAREAGGTQSATVSQARNTFKMPHKFLL